mmetsp:Transcript_30801/g.30309  ORF Transcript_30801/g.30309 Transcript_30801/m.30309 type:complete len:141 (+) Transcript_30801:743-1165(+)
MIDLLIQRYKHASLDSSRINYAKFLKDLELWDKGISPAFIWAADFAEDILKSLVIFNYNSIEQFFQRYQKLSGILLYEEFRKAVNDLQLGIYHDESEQREFFDNIEKFNEPEKVATLEQVTKVAMKTLIDVIKKLCPKSP